MQLREVKTGTCYILKLTWNHVHSHEGCAQYILHARMQRTFMRRIDLVLVSPHATGGTRTVHHADKNIELK